VAVTPSRPSELDAGMAGFSVIGVREKKAGQDTMTSSLGYCPQKGQTGRTQITS